MTMPNLTWTRERPRKKGIYKWRYGRKKKVYKVLVRPGEECMEVWWNGLRCGYLDEMVCGEWVGPIPQPEEPRG